MVLVHLDWYRRDADGNSSTGRSLQWEMVLGLTDGQSLTAFIADPMICSHVIPSLLLCCAIQGR